MFKKLRTDEGGGSISIEAVLVVTLLGIGLIVGISTLHDVVAARYGEVTRALAR